MMTCVYSRSSPSSPQFELEQLRRAADAAERVLDLVREVADQLLVDRGQVVDAFFAVGAQLLLVLEQFEQHVVGHDFEIADDRMHMQGLAPRTFERRIEMRRVETVVGNAAIASMSQSTDPSS